MNDPGFITIIGIAIGLAMDAFAVAFVSGMMLPRITVRHFFRLSFHFGLFQGLMPVLGWLAGHAMAGYAEAFGHWIAFGLLAWIGGKMVWHSYRSGEEAVAGDPTRGWRLVSLSIATSIDALAAGVSLAMIHVRIAVPALIIGIITALLTLVGMVMGQRIGKKQYNRQLERLGGVILIAIGIKIIIENLG